MYIQITTRCNMSCEHCCYSCTADGEDMSIETFKKALDDEHVSIGGGEPTVHPQFWEFLGVAIGSCEYVWLATNGKKTDTALVLAKLAKKGVIGCDLSQDEYHDYIEPKVIQAFTKTKRDGVSGFYNTLDNDSRNIRDVTGREINAGRCDFGTDKGCVCSDIICKPDGSVYACGCNDAPCFGNVNSEINIPDEWIYGECYKNN